MCNMLLKFDYSYAKSGFSHPDGGCVGNRDLKAKSGWLDTLRLLPRGILEIQNIFNLKKSAEIGQFSGEIGQFSW